MVAPGGSRVVPIIVERACQTLRLYRVTQHGVFVCDCRSPAEVAAAGVPLAVGVAVTISRVRRAS